MWSYRLAYKSSEVQKIKNIQIILQFPPPPFLQYSSMLIIWRDYIYLSQKI
jgi:hypothetical protein